MAKKQYPATPKEVYDSIIEVKKMFRKKLSVAYDLDLEPEDVEFIKEKLRFIEQYLKDNY
ncbi:MAG: hypothetical protein ABSD71_00215 [Bacteroidales bacterium]|jgi:hypothetical protein